jgi:uncharacterized SAM-binding protein YcdF (DUF218 family)
MVVAADLARSPAGAVILGEDTRRACNQAAYLANRDPRSRVVVTASYAPKFDGQWMGNLMREYIVEKRDVPADRVFAIKEGPGERPTEFNTYGEMFMLARFIKKDERAGYFNLIRIVLVVKWWHMPRALLLCKFNLRKRGLSAIPVQVVCHRSVAPWSDILIREPVAWIMNIFRMLNRW